MARRSGQEAQKMLRSIAVLIRNTTWKCGRVERLVVEYLGTHLRRYGTPWSSIRDMALYFKLKGKQRSEFLDALRRLERRQIIRIQAV